MKIKLNKAQKIKVLNSSMLILVMQQVLLREDEIERDQEYFTWSAWRPITGY